jgi:FAD/FMN-containing dehydrogenase
MVPPRIRGVFRTDERARASYSEGAGIYRIVPGAVAVPADLADLQVLVQWAARHGHALVPRGAGSAMGGGNVGTGVVVDLTALSPAMLDIDPVARTARTSAGITYGELSAAASGHGLRLPPDPSSSRWVTLGGMLATNAAGARSLRYGAVRPWVLEAAAVTADGEVARLARGEASADTAALARFHQEAAPAILAARDEVLRRFPRTTKNTAGYALDAWLASGDDLDLLIGSEGTLALVTEITWLLDPMPAVRRSILVEAPSLEGLGALIVALRAEGPSALELLDRTFLDVVRQDPPAGVPVPAAETVVLMELEGTAAMVEDGLARIEAAVRQHGGRVAVARSRDEEAALWALRHAASPILARLPESRRSMQLVEDGCVPLERLGEYIRLLRDAAGRCGLPIVLFGHAGDGHVHANLLPDVAARGWEDAVASLYEEVSAGVLALGGTPAGEHGDGRLRAPLLERLYGPGVMTLFRGVKEAFDPLTILNPGVILPARGAGPVDHLKVGGGAAPIPDDIAAALRTIERTGGYATPRLSLADP